MKEARGKRLYIVSFHVHEMSRKGGRERERRKGRGRKEGRKEARKEGIERRREKEGSLRLGWGGA